MDRRVLICAAVFLSLAAPGAVAAEPDPAGVVTYSLDLFDDFLFGKDDQITGGWTLSRHSETVEDWRDFSGWLAPLGRLGRHIPTLTGHGLRYRFSLSLGQVIQTPDDLARSDLITDDVPYAGLLALQAAWYGYDDTEFRGFALTLGVVGPASLAEEVQKGVHELVGSAAPKGWDNQLSNEPVVNLTYLRKRKLWAWRNEGWGADVTADGHLSLGNLFIALVGGLEMRLGYNLPGGFVPVADPLGESMYHRAMLEPRWPGRPSAYLSAVLRGNVVGRDLFLDGNTFTDSHRVSKEAFVGQLIVGVHFEYRALALRLQAFLTSDRVDTDEAPRAASRDRYGIATAEWRF